MRLAVQEDKGYTPLKLNDQNVEDDVTIKYKDLNIWKTPKLYKKTTGRQTVLHIVAFHILSILRLKVLQSPSKAG